MQGVDIFYAIISGWLNLGLTKILRLTGFVAQIVCRDSLYESSVIAEGDEQLVPYQI
jgi:hypothetical protein